MNEPIPALPDGLRVLHIGKYFPPTPGGMETYLRDLVSGLGRQRVNCSALVHQSHTGFRSRTETLTLGGRSVKLVRVATWLKWLFTPISPGFPFALSRMIRDTRPDLLHLHMPNVSVFWALLLPGARRLPWVVQWQSDVLASKHSAGLRLFYALYRPFERAVLERCKVVIASSQPYLETSEPLGPCREKCRVVPLGLDPAFMQAPGRPQAPGEPGTPLRVLAIGRLTYYKGFDYLLRAIALCPDVRVDLVGTGDREASLQQLAGELGITDRVTFLGHVSDTELAQCIEDADCLCLPSIERTEAFGLVLLEAMYYRRATIVSDVAGSGMGWVVEDGETGILVEPGNEQALAAAITNLAQNRDKMRRLGTNGRLRFERLFHIDKSALGILECYGLALQTGHAGD